MSKNIGVIVVAFLAGVVIAGSGAYLLTRPNQERSQPAAATPVQIPPAATAPATAEAAPTASAAAEQQPAAVVNDKAAESQRKEATRPSPSHPQAAKSDRPVRKPAASQPEPVPQSDPAPSTIPDTQPAASTEPAPPLSQRQPAPPQRTALNPPAGTVTAPPPPRTPQTVTLAAGMPITVRLNETVSTESNYAGDTFTASLDKPIIVDGYVIADHGSRVIGKVIESQKAGRTKGIANLSLALTQIHTTDGQTVHIETTPWDKQGPRSKRRDVAEIAGGAALGAIIGAIAGGGKGAAIGAGSGGAAGTGVVLTQRGKSASVPAETRLTFALDHDITITEHLNQ